MPEGCAAPCHNEIELCPLAPGRGISGYAARCDHTHVAADITDFGAAWLALFVAQLCPIGTNTGTATTASRCDHTHDASDIVGLEALLEAIVAAQVLAEIAALTGASFVQPICTNAVNITLLSVTGLTVGDTIFVEGGGFYVINSITGLVVNATLQCANQIAIAGATLTSGKTVVAVNPNSGYSGARTVVTAITFTSPNLVQSSESHIFVNGRLMSVVAIANSNIFTGVNC